MYSRRVLFSALLCVATLFIAFASAKTEAKTRRLVVMIDHNAHGFIYTINSEKVQDLLRALSKNHEDEPTAEVILLVHNKVTLAMVNNMIGILSKAGYADPPRVFVYDSYRIAMNELNFTYSAHIPFSAAGDVPDKK